MIAILLMMMGVQFNQNWLIFAIVAIMILSMRDVTTTIMLIIATVVLLVLKEQLMQYWPFVLFGLIILSLVIGGRQKEAPSQYPDMFGGGDMGGMGFGGF